LIITELARTVKAGVNQSFEIDWVNVLGIGSVHIVALLALMPYFYSSAGVFLAIAGTFVFGTLGINIFYHRYLTHKGFLCPKWVEYSLAIMAVCCFQESPARWVAIHRRHHEHSDDQPDPHTPLHSFIWAHIGWLLVKRADLSSYQLYGRYAKDVLRDPFYRKLEKYRYYLGLLLIHALLFFLTGFAWEFLKGNSLAESFQFGSSILIWGVFVRIVAVWHITWSVNSVTHIWGYKTYATGENSRNNFVIGILANGEGWHNNHHADPRSARHGHYWWELDMTYFVIRLMGILGLAWRITKPHQRSGRTDG
jgi:stearoyl-CoA desaturase (delta-9 desaturase)